MADNGGTAEQVQQEDDSNKTATNRVASLELLNGTDLVSTDEESDQNELAEGDDSKLQDGGAAQIEAVKNMLNVDTHIQNGVERKVENKDEGAAMGESAVLNNLDKNGNTTDGLHIGGENIGELGNVPKSGEGDGGPDADKDIDETDDKMVEMVPPQMVEDTDQPEIMMDSFSEPHFVDQVLRDGGDNDQTEDNLVVVDNSLLSNDNFEEMEDGDGGNTTEGTETDTSQIARELVQQALDRAVLTFNNESSSAPSLSSTQESESEIAIPDHEKVKYVENTENQNMNVETQESVEEVETEVMFESVKRSDARDTDHDFEQEDTGNRLSDMEDGDDGDSVHKTNTEFAQHQNSVDHKTQVSLDTALREITPDRDNDMNLSDTEFDGLAKLDSLPQYPDFPENYGNYKVCRSVEPGVKECLILETGECVRCKKIYTGICKTGQCTPSKSKTEVLPISEDNVPGKVNGEHTINGANIMDENIDSQQNVSESPNISISSSSSTESGKQKSFRIVKSPKKDGGTVYMAVRSEGDNSVTEKNNELNCWKINEQRVMSIGDPDDESFASLTNENDRQFAYLDNLRSSRQEELVLNNRPQQVNSQYDKKSPREISYSQFSHDNQEIYTEDERQTQIRQDLEQPERGYHRSSNTDEYIPQSYSSMPHYNRQSDRSPPMPHYNRQSDRSPLSDPSVLVRYQRNLIDRDFPSGNSADTYANFRQAPPGSESDRVDRQRKPPGSDSDRVDRQRIPSDRNVELKRDQFELTESDKALLSEIYTKYGQSKERVYDSFTSSASLDNERNRSASSDVMSSSQSTGHIPSFNTLQEQQASWMSMFRSLEREHQDELRHQYQRHQQAIFNLQQQVEREIHVQEHSFRKKLNAHKEVLAENVSPSRVPSGGEHQSIRNQDNYLDNFESVEDGDCEVVRRIPDQSLYNGRSFNLARREASPPWREIYREIRENIDNNDSADDSVNSVPIRRSLDKEFSSPDLSRARSHIHAQEQTASRSPRSPRDSRSGVKPELTPDGFPRAGVYSSPMPILRSKGKSKDFKSDINSTPQPDLNNSMGITSPSLSEQQHSTLLKHDLESRHRERLQQQQEKDSELIGNSFGSDDVCLSSSTRMNLREKHAKHLSDLREYYEKELSELRSAISTSENIMSQTPYKRVASENQNLHVENRLLKEKVAELEEDLDISRRNIRELEQKVHGLEVRASDYADHLTESQSKLSTFRNKMEEMQYQSREYEQQMKELEAKVTFQANALKNSKRKQTKNVEMLQEEQADIIIKDQSSVQKMLEKYNVVERDHNILKEVLNGTENKLYDARKEVVELNRTVAKLELENKRLGRENDNLRHKAQQSMNLSSIQGSFHEAFSSPEEHGKSSLPGHNSASSRLLNGSFEKPQVTEPPRTPRRNQVSDAATANDLHNGESLAASPLMKAEQDVYKLRNMMLSCTQEQTSISEPKLQKKFYGSEIPSQSRNSDSFSSYGSPKFRRDKSPSSSATSRYMRMTKSNKISNSSDQSINSPSQSTPKRLQGPSPKFSVEPGEFTSPTRFDVSSSSKRSRSGSGSRLSSRRQPGDGQPEKDSKFSPKSRSNTSKISKNKPVLSVSSNENVQKTDKDIQVSVTETLNRVRSGVYVARPEWEDVYTSMVQPKKNNTESSSIKTREDRIKTMDDMEHRYDDLQAEKRKLESALSKVSSHGKGRLQKEQLEDKLDVVEKELGSVRMSLKRWNILKTCS